MSFHLCPMYGARAFVVIAPAVVYEPCELLMLVIVFSVSLIPLSFAFMIPQEENSVYSPRKLVKYC